MDSFANGLVDDAKRKTNGRREYRSQRKERYKMLYDLGRAERRGILEKEKSK